MEQKELDKYWMIFNTDVKAATILNQRKVALAFCELVSQYLDIQGLRALNVIKELTQGNVSKRKRIIWQKKMQGKISRNKSSPYSVLSWSLESDNPSYPPWYAAGIAGLNIVDLKIATLNDLRKLTRKTITSPD